jgi:L-aspartate oxidase
LRAGGDATGAELVRAVALAVHDTPSVVLFEGARALDVALDEQTHAVTGLYVRDENGDVVTLSAPAVVLATGGIGGLYRYTTNPIASRGTGIAIAARAGATLADLEFVQFHPTALDVPSDPLPLVSEAVRGEGAFLVDAAGDRIMAGVDPALELAPRDIVARRVAGVHREGRRVYLDARAITDDFAERFPTIFASCMRFGIDPRVAPIPIVAAEHYHMGGIAVDERGRSDVPGLYACGEVAATGVHGANRLASNSLLESVVYPERIAADIRAVLAAGPARIEAHPRAFAPRVEAARADFDRLRDQMTNAVGVLRSEADLEIARNLFLETAANASAEDLRDAATTSALMAHAALARRESRGGHFRTDFPSTNHEERRSSTRLTDIDLHAALAFAADEHTLSTTSG